jgi:hypothetical protein
VKCFWFLGLNLSWACHVHSDKGGLRFDHRLHLCGQPSSSPSPAVYLYASEDVSVLHLVDGPLS